MILGERTKQEVLLAAAEPRTDFPDNTFAVTISNNWLLEKLCSIHRASAAVIYLSISVFTVID